MPCKKERMRRSMKGKNARKRRALLAVFMAFTMTASIGAYAQPAISSTVQVAAQNSGEYAVTPEAGVDMKMDNHPEASYWFPEDLLNWNAAEDPDLKYNVSTVPLAKRVDNSKLKTVNETQNNDTKMLAISIMNGSTSGNLPHGINNTFGAHTFSYWQYVDTLVYWGGSSGEGLIVTPSPDVTDAAHTNGVPVLGTVFFPQMEHGGKVEWLDTFLQKDENGNFPIVDKLVEVAHTYGFDGWFINQETQGDSDGNELKKEHADLMQELIKQLKEKAPDLEIFWYDSMTKDGEMAWQGALNENNSVFMIDEEGNRLADEMFLDFRWGFSYNANNDLLRVSRENAEKLGIDPYDIYAGIDVQANGYNTDARWGLLEREDGSTNVSLGLYCPSWTYFSAQTKEDYEKNESILWVNEAADPSQSIKPENSGVNNEVQAWRGVSTYVVERTAVTTLPLITNFNIGNGENFFKNGQKISELDWNNRSVQDIMPTYRWLITNEGSNTLTGNIDYDDAYYGGNSIKFTGSLEAGKKSEIKLYSSELALEEGLTCTTTAKTSNGNANLNLVLEFSDGTKQVVAADKAIGADWTTVSYDISGLAGKTVTSIGYELSSPAAATDVKVNIGNLTMANTNSVAKATTAKDIVIEDSKYDEDEMCAGIRMSWTGDENAEYYEVYRVNADGTKMFYGITNVPNIFLNAFERRNSEASVDFEVIPYDALGNAGTSATTTMQWPKLTRPEASFTASKTLISVGESVTFTSTSSKNTQSVEWKLPGASIETSTDNTVTVTYDKPGVYSASLSAINDIGGTIAMQTGMIIVTDKVSEGLTNLSLNKATEADAYVSDAEAPQFAVDGDKSKKWCATGKAPHWITIDLGETKTVSEVSITHAEGGGEGADMNTMEYIISVSNDGENFTDLTHVTKNRAGETTDAFKPVEARYVKLTVVKPTQGSDTAARIYEITVNGYDGPKSDLTAPVEEPLAVTYRTHVQNDGWQDFVSNGELSGTSGRGLRLEGIEIYLDNNTMDGGVEYRTHVQNEGWQDYVANGVMSGTKGKGLRLEAIQVRLTGEVAEKYDIYYRTHIQDKGWLGWAVNDGKSGSAGLSKRLEAIEIRLVEKGGAAPGSTDNAYLTNQKEANPTISYRTHVQNDGWQDYVAGGEMSGTKNRSLRLEAIQIKVNGDGLDGGVEYATHVQNEGWQDYVSDDAMSGTKGKSLRLEAIKIRLTGELAQKYSVEYRTHVQNEGWKNWVKDDAVSGTTGKNLRLEAIEIRLIKK